MHAEGQGGMGGGGVSKNYVKVKGGVSKNQAWHILHCTSPPVPINNDQSLKSLPYAFCERDKIVCHELKDDLSPVTLKEILANAAK